MNTPFDPKTLSENDLCKCLQEMRQRGWVCAAYAADDVAELLDARNNGEVEQEEIASWLHENHAELEQALCEGMYAAVEAEWPPND